MDDNMIMKRMSELIRPIDEAVMMCDSREEILMMASLMQIRLKDIYDAQIGEAGRKKLFRDLC